MEQKVAEAHASVSKGMSLEDKINEKIQSHADDDWFLVNIFVVDTETCLLWFERDASES